MPQRVLGPTESRFFRAIQASHSIPRRKGIPRLKSVIAPLTCHVGRKEPDDNTSKRKPKNLKDFIEKKLVKDCGKYAGYETQIQDIVKSVEDEQNKLRKAQSDLSAKEDEIRMLRCELENARELNLDCRPYSMKLKWATDNSYRRKMLKAIKNRKITETTKRKMSRAKKGRTTPQEVRVKQSIAHKGMKASEEAREKMRKAARRRWSDKTLRAKWLEARWGKHYDRERKAILNLNSKYRNRKNCNESVSINNAAKDGSLPSEDVSLLENCKVSVESGIRLIDAVRLALENEKASLLSNCDLDLEEGDSGEVTLVMTGDRQNVRKIAKDIERWRRGVGNVYVNHEERNREEARSTTDLRQSGETTPCKPLLFDKGDVDRLLGLHGQLKIWTEAYMHRNGNPPLLSEMPENLADDFKEYLRLRERWLAYEREKETLC